MKKTLSILLAIIMLLSLCACGGTGADDANDGAITTEAPVTEPQDELAGTSWSGLYNRTPIQLNNDNSLTVGEMSGTWERNGDSSIGIAYTTTNGSMIERTLDIAEENGSTVLKARAEGKLDGSATNFTVDTYYLDSEFAAAREAVIKKAGETVSTDIADFTLDSAQFSYYASALSSSFAEPIEADDGGIFTASTGRTFVCMTFTITNKDRGNSLDIGGSFGYWRLNFSAHYNGESYSVKGYDLNSKDGTGGLNLAYAALSYDGGVTFSKGSTSNILLKAGQTVTIRTVGVITVEPQDLKDSFDLTVNVLNSSNKSEYFLYEIG